MFVTEKDKCILSSEISSDKPKTLQEVLKQYLKITLVIKVLIVVEYFVVVYIRIDKYTVIL